MVAMGSEKKPNPDPGAGNIPLGRALEEQIGGWVSRVERTGHWTKKSDIHARLMGAVEKIVIRAALEKMKFVQVDTADFLGINRNTLAKKIAAYGIRIPRE
jgi:DNA-binding NtrC family response regulator